MPAPRLSQAAIALEDANAAQAFNEKKWVWIPDIQEGYLAGWINSEDGETAEVVCQDVNEIRRVPLDLISKMNPPKFDRVEDIADLTFLNEASVVHNLRLRYGSGAIYTYSGLFLVAINPYQDLKLYTDKIIQQYRSKRNDENPPHVFAVAERAWVNMGDERENQSILITGESGAGKTESTKKVIQYLAAIATDSHVSHSRTPTLAHSPSHSSMPSIGLPRNASLKNVSAATSSTLSTSTSGFLAKRSRLGLLERQILQANPILEAFGNAQTQRNNNSSRFGKFIRIMFAPDMSISGASIDWYLLEKNRVVRRAEGERNFHVFYQILAGPTGGNEKERELDRAKQALKQKLLLDGTADEYEYLNRTRREVDGVDDRIEWNALQAALDTVGFSAEEQLDLFRIISAILHIGNIQMSSTRPDDAAKIVNIQQVERVCHILGIPVQSFIQAIESPKVRAGREWVTQARTVAQSTNELAALCKTFYEKSFGSLVERINQALDRPSSKSAFIGVLDIAGFEIFEVNGYDQLLINFTNEKLQQFFNQHMFVLEQEEYKREGIQWDYVNFGLNLQPTIDLIEYTGSSNTSNANNAQRNGSTLAVNGNTSYGVDGAIGILSCLDEECIMPRATDVTFTEKLHSFWAPPARSGQRHPRYEPLVFAADGFRISHYAADVEYRTDGWLEKNKDPLNDNMTRVIAASGERYIAGLFSEFADSVAPAGKDAANAFPGLARKRGVKKGAFRTVAQRHKEQLGSLMAQLQATQPHFVRCIVPNSLKKPGRIDVPLVLDQLRCNGVLEGIRIARMGYPNRMPFIEFRQRYEILTESHTIPRGYMDGREACRRIVQKLDLDEVLYKLGTSKIFFKAGVLADLEERRDAILYMIFSSIQAAARRYSTRRQVQKVLNRSTAIRTIQKNARIYGELRDWPWWKLYTRVRPLLAATRNDDELRRKEAELLLVKELAERDKQEREALESLKMSLEAEKRKVEEALESEKELTLNKEALLERALVREAELQEEADALQAEIQEADDQMERLLAISKDNDRKHNDTKQHLQTALDKLDRLEPQQQQWRAREAELVQQLQDTRAEIASLRGKVQTLEKVGEELKNLATQRQEDLTRSKDRSDVQLKELEGKLKVEIQSKEMIKDKIDSLEDEARIAKQQLNELTLTTTEYSSMIEKKEERIASLIEDLAKARDDHTVATREVLDLRSDIDTLAGELEDTKSSRDNAFAARSKLETELDDLRSLLAAKTTEVSKRNEAEKSMTAELTDLRSQTHKLQQEYADARSASLEAQGKLKKELELISSELATLRTDYTVTTKKESTAQIALKEAQQTLSDLEKQKRSLESELQSVRSKQHETESEVDRLTKAKESAERQLTAAQTKYHSIEDLMLQLERDKAAQDRQLDSTKKRLEEESALRNKLERSVSTHKTDLAKAKARNDELDRALNQALNDLKQREWEVKQLESKQDKTIVEHVHVLEEAKRVTDRELIKAQEEIQRQRAHIESLQNARNRLKGENEDIARMKELEQLELRTMEKAARQHQDRLTKSITEADKERQAREVAELEAKRARNHLQDAKQEIEDLEHRLAAAQQSKADLESELDRIADETVSPTSVAKVQREYEARIAKLQEEVENRDSTTALTARLRERIDRQHGEIRRLILNSGPQDSNFQSRLLEELKSLDDTLDRDLPRSKHPRVSTSHFNTPTSSPSKFRPPGSTSSPSQSGSDKQVSVLKQQVEFLELQIASSDRIRQHLQTSLKDLSSDLEHSDGSKQSLQQYRLRLAKENARLKELLALEAETQRGDASQLKSVKEVWAKFQDTLSSERKSYSRLEESKKALLVQQRTVQAELDSYRSQVSELGQVKKSLQSELASTVDKLAAAQSEAASAKRKLQKHIQEEELSTVSSAAHQADMQNIVNAFRTKEKEQLDALEAKEIERAKAARAEAAAKRSLEDLQKTMKDSSGDTKSLQSKLASSERKIRELEAKIQKEGGDHSGISQRLAEEIEDQRSQHRKELEETEFKQEQTRNKYQAELASLSSEVQSQRDSITNLRNENRKLRTDYDELQFAYEDEVYKYNESGAKKEKERLETKIQDLQKAFDAAAGAQMEQQDQIVHLHAQVRNLRSALAEVETEREMLRNAREALKDQLAEIRLEPMETGKVSSDPEFQALNLERRDLMRQIDEQQDRTNHSIDRMRRAEAHANGVSQELGKVRVENSELDRRNASLEKQIKELNVKIVDLETRTFANSPRTSLGRRQDTRIEEITNQLHGRPSALSPVEQERQRARFEEQRNQYENTITDLRMVVSDLQSDESQQQAARRAAERNLNEARQQLASQTGELDRLRARLQASSGFGSPGRK